MQIPLQIDFHGVDHSDSLAARIRTRVARLEKIYPRITRCRVTVESPHRHRSTGRVFSVRIDLTLPGKEIVVSRHPSVKEAHRDPYVAVRDAFDVARRELQDFVKRRDEFVRPPSHPLGLVTQIHPEDGGFGFLLDSEGVERYFHRNTVLNHHFDQLEPGMEVKFTPENGENGPQASTVEWLHQPRRKTA